MEYYPDLSSYTTSLPPATKARQIKHKHSALIFISFFCHALQRFIFRHQLSLTFKRSILSPVCTDQKDERAMTLKPQNTHFLFSHPVTLQYFITLLLLLLLLLLILLLLLLLLSSSSSSPLCMVFIHIFLRQTMSLGNTVFQLFCHYYLWCLYR